MGFDPGQTIIDYYGPYIRYNLIEYCLATVVFIVLLVIYNKKSNKDKIAKRSIINTLLVSILCISVALTKTDIYGYEGYLKALKGTILYIFLIILVLIMCIVKTRNSKKIIKPSKGEK